MNKYRAVFALFVDDVKTSSQLDDKWRIESRHSLIQNNKHDAINDLIKELEQMKHEP